MKRKADGNLADLGHHKHMRILRRRGTGLAADAPRDETREGLAHGLDGPIVLVTQFLRRWSGLVVAALLVLLFGVLEPGTFLQVSTFRDTASGAAITAIASLGLLFPMMAGEFDLSIGYLIGGSGVLAAWLMGVVHTSPLVAGVVAISFGALVGLGNALIIIYLKIDSFIATLATGSLLTAMTLAVSHEQQIVGISPSFISVTAGEIGSLPIVIVYTAVVALLAWYVSEHTAVGRRLYALGGGRQAARLAGVQHKRLIVGAFVFSAVMASVGGLLVVGSVSVGSPDVGPEYLLPVFAAVFLGATQVRPGRSNAWGTMIAVYVLALGVKGLQLAGAQSWVTSLFDGIALIVAVGLSKAESRALIQRVRRTPLNSDAHVDRGAFDAVVGALDPGIEGGAAFHED